MEHYLLLKIVHSASSVLLLLGLLVHLFMLWKAHRGGDAAVLLRKLRNTRRYSSPALGLVALSLPLSGWWLVHLAGLPLGQLWLLLSATLLLPLLVCWLLLDGRLRAWIAAGEQVPANTPRLALLYAGLMLAILLAIFALMGAKPA
jgi:uncharacterized membrane protein